VNAIHLAAPCPARLILGIEFHDPPGQLGVVLSLDIEPEPKAAKPIDARGFSVGEEMKFAGVRVSALAENIPYGTRNTFADFAARNHSDRT